MQLAVRPSVPHPSLRGWLPVQATHNGGGGRGQTTSLPKRKREERRGGKKLLICATWSNEGGRGRQMQTAVLAQARTAFGGSSATTPALFCRPDAWESAGDFWAYFRFQGMELLPFGGAERGTRAEGDRGNMGSKELAAEVPRNREVPSCPFRDPAEMGSAACPIYCRRFPRGNEDEVRKPWAARRKLFRCVRARSSCRYVRSSCAER